MIVKLSLYDAFSDSSAEVPNGPRDPFMMWVRILALPRNSGVQNVLPKIFQAYQRAKMLRPPYRNIAINKVKSYLYGIAGISSENGFMARELNTHRISQHQQMQTNVGPDYDDYDSMFYGNKHFQNNKKGKGDALAMNF